MELSPLSKLPSWGASTLEGFDTSNVQDGQRIKGSTRQFVRFYEKKFMEVYATKVKINDKTGSTQVLETGIRPRVREMVEIVTPGDTNKVDDFAEDYHRREHWRHYKQFRDGSGIPLGKSLDECTYISSNVATELKYLQCHTEEQLAEASDSLCNMIPDGYSLREFARAVVRANLENASLNQVNVLKAQNDEMKAAMAAMKQDMERLSGLVDTSGTPIPTVIKARTRAPNKKKVETTIEA